MSVTKTATDPKGWIELSERAARDLREQLEAAGKPAIRLSLRGFD